MTTKEVTTFDLAGSTVEEVAEHGEPWRGCHEIHDTLGYTSYGGFKNMLTANRHILTERMVRTIVVQTKGGPQPKLFASRIGMMLLCCFAGSAKAKEKAGPIVAALMDEVTSRAPMPKIGKAGRYPVSMEVRLVLEALLSEASPDNPLVPLLHAFLTGAVDPVKHPVLEKVLVNQRARAIEFARLMQERRADEEALKAVGLEKAVLKPAQMRARLRAEQLPQLAFEEPEE